MMSWTAIFPLSHIDAEKDVDALAESANIMFRGAICLKSLTNVVESVWDWSMYESQGRRIQAKIAPIKARVWYS